jgi:Homeobox KN domain
MLELLLEKGHSFTSLPAQILMEWLLRNFGHPYPTEDDKDMLARLSGLTRAQVQQNREQSYLLFHQSKGVVDSPGPRCNKADKDLIFSFSFIRKKGGGLTRAP